MPNPGLSSTWGAQSWSPVLIQALSAESALLRSAATRVVIAGRVAHLPRILLDGQASWTAELAEIPSNAGDADTIVLTPRALKNLVVLSNESIADAAVNELDAVGASLVRGVASQLDARAFSSAAATATAPRGLLAEPGIPTSAPTEITVESLFRAAGDIEGRGGRPDTAWLNPLDLTELRIAAVGSAYNQSTTVEAGGVEMIGGLRLIGTPALPASKALVAESRFVLLAIRQDATVDFSGHHSFGRDGQSVRVVMRTDFAVADPNALHLVNAT